MQAIRPFVTVTNDTESRIMARSGEIVGFSKSRVVWRFGFLPGSDSARAFGASTDGFLWVISDYNGKVLEQTGYCSAMDLSPRYHKIIGH